MKWFHHDPLVAAANNRLRPLKFPPPPPKRVNIFLKNIFLFQHGKSMNTF